MSAPSREQQGRLEELAGFVIELAAGHLSARLTPSPASDELDAIVVGLNMLAEELQGLTEELETRVEQRTRQLAVAHAELERLALYDPLTGLANRTLLAERIGQAATRDDRPPAVLMLDLDGFKAVNDTFGHPVGDQLLVVVADRLRAVVRETDTVARLGGDEFAVVVDGAEPDDVLEIADRVRRVLAEAVSIGGRTCWVGASVGVRLAEPGDTPEDLLRDADTAMYSAKGRSPGSVCLFEASMGQAALSRTRLADELRTALIDDQLAVYFQPIVDLATGRIAGAEALVRWHHPQRGLLGPDFFVPVAEDTGIITPLDRWVLATSVAELRRWRDTVIGDSPFRLHVNVSPVELRAPRFADEVVTCIRRHGLPTEDVTVEITERNLLGDDTATTQSMGNLRAAGVGIAIDDFGTGSSSIGYLRRAFVDTIKIDRSLLHGLDVVPRQHRVAGAVVGVIDALGLDAVGEGIETAGEAEQLRALGCRFGQGYHWNMPLTGQEMAERLRAEA